MNKIEVLDAMCGTGKTQGVIKWMLDNPNKRYLYVSPMLTEVEERIPNSCDALEFVYPVAVTSGELKRNKGEHLLQLLKENRNICFTHSLFSELSKAHFKEIKAGGYTLIIDEEFGIIEPYSGVYKKGDISSLVKAGHISVDENNLGQVKWLWEDMEDKTQYSKLRSLCDNNMLYCSKRSMDMMVVQLPMALITSSERTIVLTYLFTGSVMEAFLKLKGVEIHPFTEVELMKSTESVIEDARKLITIGRTKTTEAVRNSRMSVVFLTTSATRCELDKISNAIRSVVRKHGNDTILYTTMKDAALRFKGNTKVRNVRCVSPRNLSVEETYLHCGARATNNFAHKSVALHAYNRFINLTVKSYLQDYGAEFGAIPDDNLFALSELIQWVWRTRIRDDQPITVYILSCRMEDLFTRWLNTTDTTERCKTECYTTPL